MLAFCAALLAFGVVYTAVTFLGAKVGFATKLDPSLDWYFGLPEKTKAALVANEGPLILELWLMSMTPPPLYRPCYTTNSTVCNLLKEAFASELREFNRPFAIPNRPFAIPDWYLLFLACAGVGLLAGVLFCAWTRRFTGQAKHPNETNL
jgi:hypothetical protein